MSNPFKQSKHIRFNVLRKRGRKQLSKGKRVEISPEHEGQLLMLASDIRQRSLLSYNWLFTVHKGNVHIIFGNEEEVDLGHTHNHWYPTKNEILTKPFVVVDTHFPITE